MRFLSFCTAALICGSGLFAAPQDTDPGSRTVIKTETRLVLVDAVVKDKKGAPIRDLGEKDFKVWEDGKEQTITKVTLETDSSLNDKRRQYFVLLFDNSTSQPQDQIAARDAAVKFIERNAGPNRVMAVMEYGGMLRIAQNFTGDPEKLKAAAKRVKLASMGPASPGGDAGGPRMAAITSGFGSRNVLMALSSVAKGLGEVPGRKTLVFFSAGFPLTPDLISEVTAAINACNRANVAVYPIDVRGLVAPGGAGPTPGASGRPGGMAYRLPEVPVTSAAPFMLAFQKSAGASNPSPGVSTSPSRGGAAPPSTSPNPGGTRSGSTSGMPTTRPGSTGNNTTNAGRGGGTMNNPGMMNPMTNGVRRPYVDQFSKIMPNLDSSSTNQQVLQMLAEGTGGLVILNTNDLLAGLEKIANDQNEYYIISYVPVESEEGTCHGIKLKVNKGGSIVRSRTGYCNAKEVDALAGSSAEKTLEGLVAGSGKSLAGASMQVPFFYSASDTARVNVAMEIPYDAVHFDHKKGKYTSAINLLGIAYRGGQVAARFSDTVNLSFETKKDMEAAMKKQFHYESQFDIAPGTYNLKVAFDSGKDGAGKLEMPLVIDQWDGKKLALSGFAFAKEIRPLSQTDSSLTVQLLEDRKPLIASGAQITPSGSNRLKKSAVNAVYLEIYDPALAGAQPPALAAQVRFLDAKTGEQKNDSGLFRLDKPLQEGNPVVPLGVRLLTEALTPGMYRLEIKALDSAGNAFTRTTDVEIE